MSRIKLGELDAVPGNRVNVWRLDPFLSVTSEFRISEIIGEQENDIGLAGFCSFLRLVVNAKSVSRNDEPKQQEKQTEGGDSHHVHQERLIGNPVILSEFDFQFE